MKVVGIDLAGVETKPTGFSVLDHDLNAETSVLYSDEEILKEVQRIRPSAVAVDAPLFLPLGRWSLEERSDIHLRLCDRQLLAMKIRFFPITLGPMRALTSRGIRLKKLLKRFDVVEVFPGAAQDILGIPRKQKGLKSLREGLERLGIKGLRDDMTGDELDAVTSALVAKLYVDGEFTALGDPEEGLMIIPKIQRIPGC